MSHLRQDLGKEEQCNEDDMLKCKSYQRIKAILHDSDSILNFCNQHDEPSNIKYKFHELFHHQYASLTHDFNHIKHEHITKPNNNTFDLNYCDIQECHYMQKHTSKAFNLIKRIHLYVIHFYEVNNGNITFIMDDHYELEPKFFHLIIKEICSMQSEGIDIKKLKFKWLSSMPFENKLIANKLFIQYFNELLYWHTNHSPKSIQFDLHQVTNDNESKQIAITKCHIRFKHVLLVEGYGKNIGLYIPQSILDAILFFYAKPLIISVKRDRESKPIYILYCLISDTWNSMIRQINKRQPGWLVKHLFYGDQGNKKLTSKKWISWLEISSEYLLNNCLYLQNLVVKQRDDAVFESEIIPTDGEVIAELKSIAICHNGLEEAIIDLSQRLPFEDETNMSVAETMMRHINNTEDDIDLLYTTSEESESDSQYNDESQEESEEDLEEDSEEDSED